MARTRIKICGILDEDILAAAVASGADAVGFNFVKSSVRYIDPDEADRLTQMLPPLVVGVGIFADPSYEAFCDIEEQCPFLAFNQLHGSEGLKTVKQCGPDVIKAVRFDPTTIGAELLQWAKVEEVAAVLIDGGAGGEGKTLDWERVAEALVDNQLPVFLAGGLTPDNVGEAIRLVRPYAVDVASGVESERGVKDADLIEAFCRAVRAADVACEDEE